jgi:hypothetical protein
MSQGSRFFLHLYPFIYIYLHDFFHHFVVSIIVQYHFFHHLWLQERIEQASERGTRKVEKAGSAGVAAAAPPRRSSRDDGREGLGQVTGTWDSDLEAEHWKLEGQDWRIFFFLPKIDGQPNMWVRLLYIQISAALHIGLDSYQEFL